MSSLVQWSFEADYLTACNCDWGCPCNFNARPTQGHCNGFGAWRIKEGQFGHTSLDDVVCAVVYFFPGPIDQGNGTARTYINSGATPEQQRAIDAICSGRQGGGIFEIFASLATTIYPTMTVPIKLEIDGGKGRVKIGDLLEMESELLRYPDGTVIEPTFTLPHGIEFKTGLATNARRWWVKDEDMLGTYQDKYAAVATVRFNNQGCIA